MKKFIQSLTAFEASQVLMSLLNENPGLLQNAYDCALKIAIDVDIESICDSVYTCLSMLHIEELNDRIGMSQHSYVDHDEAALELLEEVLASFIGDIVENRKRNLPAAAKACCIGIVKGIRMYDEDPDSEFGGWVEDVTGECIDTVIKEWKKGNPSREDIADVMRVVNGENHD